MNRSRVLTTVILGALGLVASGHESPCAGSLPSGEQAVVTTGLGGESGEAPLAAGAPDWLLTMSPSTAPARSYHAMAYDSARGRVVVFGGLQRCAGETGDTWEWDGYGWVERTPAIRPPARWEHAMAYDSARQRVVMFGGVGYTDTWEWDGNVWIERAPATSPSWRAHHRMAYDSARGRIVLFGGWGSSGNLAETWEWDGNTWIERTPAVSPSPRYGHGMAYDSARGRVVLFGGWGNGSVYLADTWEWNGSAWVERTPAAGPTARPGTAMAYDSARGRVVLFGGGAGSSGNLADTWEWDGNAWVERPSAATPPARHGHAMAYDSARGRAVVFGGTNYFVDFGDTWEWNGSAWLERTPATRPSPRGGHAMAYDSARGRVVLFGGYQDPDYLADTLEWDGGAWTERTPATSPSPRYRPAMAYDSARGRVVLFGGYGPSGHLGDTWEWDGSAWVERTPATGPAPRDGHGMVFDSARERVVLFGGAGASVLFGDTWEWDGSAWIERTPATSPSPRTDYGIAFDTTHGRLVLFGGEGEGYLGDTWEWDGSAWTERTPATSPSPRSLHTMAYDSTRRRVVLFGGSWYLLDTWEWDGSAWVEEAPATSPPNRSLHAMVFDSARERVVLFGGRCALGDMWEYGPIEGCGHAVSVVAFVPGTGTDDTSAVDVLGPPDGQAASLGLGGSLVLRLDPPVLNGWGADLAVHENGVSALGLNENYRVEVSEDGVEYVFARDCPGDDCQLDLAQAGLSGAQYVRLTDSPPDEGESAPDAGADIDSISVVRCETVVEMCNGIDEGNDGFFPPDEIDHDGDRYVGCAPWSGSDPDILGGGDCAPVDASDYPGAPELCDGRDNDCANGLPASETDFDGDTYVPCAGDCDDLSPAVHPGATETCNVIDDDCDLLVDEDELGEDSDGDGVHSLCDNCPTVSNASQTDGDADGPGDACDPCPADPANDADGDGTCGDVDNCPTTTNPGQADMEGDGIGDACDNCPNALNASQTDGDGELFRDWAWAAVASSEYSSGGWSAMQAAGAPESVGICEDVPTSWAPLGGTPDPEWLELSYFVPVKAVGVDVHETFGERFVRQIDLRDTSGSYHVAWRGTDPTTCGDVLEARWAMTPFTVDRVVVRTAAPGWEEIDAVELLGVYDSADGLGDVCDNCPEYSNPTQADFDGDGAGDACDCAPADLSIRPAAAVDGVFVESLGAGAARLSWEPAAGAASYAIIRGELSALSATHMGDCRVRGWTSLEWDDAELPPPNQGLAYLVQGESPVCGPGTLGFGAYGRARINTGSDCPE